MTDIEDKGGYVVIHVSQLAEASLPEDWAAQARALWCRESIGYTRHVPRGSEAPGSWVDGPTIQEHLPWLDTLYRGPVREWVSRVHGRPFKVGTTRDGGMNIKLLRGSGYECNRHLDHIPMTCLLYGTDIDGSKGGTLELESDHGPVTYFPKAGELVTFEGQRLYHWVEPMRDGAERLSIPMNFFAA